MEFYKIVHQAERYQLEEEEGQDGSPLDNRLQSLLAQALYSCYQQQDHLPLTFRKYLMAYYNSGETEYVALAEAECLASKPLMDGFASTWLEGEEENRVWIGVDGAVENRGPSAEKVRFVLELLVDALQDNRTCIVLNTDSPAQE